MNINKKFNAWIASKFRGLSAHTLCQFIKMFEEECWQFCSDTIDNFVYVTLFRVFVGIASEEEVISYNVLVDLVEDCEWL